MVARFLASLLVLALMSTGARADLIRFFGDERIGSSGGQFLRIPTGARGIAMGGGMSAAVEGGSAPFWNPAGMSAVRGPGRLFLSHTEYVADIGIDHLAYVHRGGSWQIGLMAGVLRSGEMLRTTELHPNGAGFTFEANQFLGGLSVGRNLTDRFSIAGTAKLLQENLDEYESRGVFVDLGALYRLGFRRSRIGFAIRNLGSELRLNGTPPPSAQAGPTWQGFAAPTIAVFGFSTDFGHAPTRRVTVSIDFSHPSDDIESLIFGGELALKQRLFLRGGYENNGDEGQFSAGFGLRFLDDGRTVRFDYAYDDEGTFGGIHMFSVELGR